MRCCKQTLQVQLSSTKMAASLRLAPGLATHAATRDAPAAPPAIAFTAHTSLRYAALTKATVRAGAALNSKRAGRVRAGDVIQVLESREDVPLRRPGATTLVRRTGTVTRLRFAGGWVSLTARDGTALFKMVGAAESREEARTLVQNPMLDATPSPQKKTVARVCVYAACQALLSSDQLCRPPR